MGLQLANLPAQGRLGDMASLGRAAKVTEFGNGQHVFQIPQVHGQSGEFSTVSDQDLSLSPIVGVETNDFNIR
jgi:hypothetical protein